MNVRRDDSTLTYKAEANWRLHRLDLLVDHKLVVELKAVEETARVHKAQVLSYAKAAKVTSRLAYQFQCPQAL